MKILNKILNKIYKPDDKAGEGAGTGNTEPDKTNTGGLDYDPNEETLYDPIRTGGRREENTQSVESDIHDFHNDETQTLLGNPTVTRPQKKQYRDVDSALNTQYFANLEKR